MKSLVNTKPFKITFTSLFPKPTQLHLSPNNNMQIPIYCPCSPCFPCFRCPFSIRLVNHIKTHKSAQKHKSNKPPSV